MQNGSELVTYLLMPDREKFLPPRPFVAGCGCSWLAVLVVVVLVVVALIAAAFASVSVAKVSAREGCLPACGSGGAWPPERSG